MKMDYLKKLGILGVSFGLMASPLAFAQVDSTDEYEPTPQEETTQDEQGTYKSYDTEQDKGSDVGTEYEEEEQEFTYEEEEEEQEVPATDEEEDDSGW
ncbi:MULTISPECIES: hypothetical protein [unclassified Halomonas]|nr:MULTISPECIES: hypothetical protein [unclassified Halomonas]MBT2786034.1 hypothetical protein [Halomonas sp. ISL-106]MBT2797056.1 hypothetical protein [Halomonas sp. ISL-104]OAL59027.1 hypothetical protein A6R74_05990 [Halomonas sp. ALS9]